MARAVAVFTEAIKSYGRVSSRSMDSTLGGLLVEAGTFLGFWQSSIQSVQLHQLFYSLRLAKYCSVQKPSSNLISANSGDIHRETNLSMTIVMITGSAGLIGSESNRIDSSLIVKEVTKQSVLIAASISLFGASKVVADVLVQE